MINTSSVSAGASRRLAAAGRERQLAVLDAPVSGSTREAKGGELVVLVGGGAGDMARAGPILDAIGKKTVHVGPSGQGSTVKLVVNGIMVSGMAVIAEAVSYGWQLGSTGRCCRRWDGVAVISPHHKLKLAAAGGGNIAPQFPAWLAHKDLGLLLADAAAHGVSLLANAAATQLMSPTTRLHGKDDHSAVLPVTESLGGG